MRRKIHVFLLLTGILLLAACGGGEAPSPSPSPSEGGEAKPLVQGGEPEGGAFAAQYIRTDGGREKTAYPYAVVIRSRAELEAYYEANRDLFDLERKEKVYSDTTIGFLDACDKYDDAYFENHDLIFAVLEEGSGSIRHEVAGVDWNGETGAWQVRVRSIVPEVGTCDMAQWHIIVEGRAIGEGEKVGVAYEGRATRAEYSYGYISMALDLPEGWEYSIKEHSQEDSSFGISFWPQGAGEGRVNLYYFPLFGVCGTGLTEKDYTFDSGLTGRMGSYGGNWDFIVFDNLPDSYVAMNEGANLWWGEYGEQAMEILGSARLGQGGIGREEAILMVEKQCTVSNHDYVSTWFDVETGKWTVEYWEAGASLPVQTAVLSADGRLENVSWAE